MTIEDLQRRRNYKDFVEWIESTQNRFSETEETRATARLCVKSLSRRYKDAIKRFHEEALPIYILLRAMYADRELNIWLPADDGPCDAYLQIDGRTECIQIADSIDGHDNSRRMAILSREGSVPAFSSLSRHKDAQGRKYDVAGDLVAMPRVSVVTDIIKLLASTIATKKRKPYPTGTWLVVWFHDPHFLKAEDLASIEAAAVELVRGAEFARAFLVGRVDPPFCRTILDRTLQ